MIELSGSAAAAGKRGVLSNDSGIKRFTKKPKRVNKYAVIRQLTTKMRNAILQGASYNDEHYQVAMSYPGLSDNDLKTIEQEAGTDLSIYVRDLYNNFLAENNQ